MPQWTSIDWENLGELRQNFLQASVQKELPDYWCKKSLEDYHLTLGKRIEWKLRFVLQEAGALGWAPTPTRFVEWGCGAANASLSFVQHFSEHFQHATLLDRSAAAKEFSRQQFKLRFPELSVSHQANEDKPFVLLVSHVLGELAPKHAEELVHFAKRADSIVWIEPGTSGHSRKLIEVREQLRQTFSVVAPCPHQSSCALLNAEQSHWCHHFARVPQEVFHDPDWALFSKKLSVDLRSLPVSYLVLDRQLRSKKINHRVLGRPKHSSKISKVLLCRSDCEIENRTFTKSKDREWIRLFKKRQFPTSL